MVQDYQPGVIRTGAQTAEIDAGLRAYMGKVYMLMATAMVLTGVVAFGVGTNQYLLETFFTGPMRWVVMFAPLAFVFGFAAMINRMSTEVATAVFYAFSAVMGLSIAWIFVAFQLGTIFQAFFATAVAFLGLSIYGYTTQRDLSAFGRFLIMGLIGVIVLVIVNIFVGSSILALALNAAILLIFAGLTAYDTQRLKNEYVYMAQAGPEGQAYLEKGAIMGALSLYLNFINMFMVMLQFMGGGDE